MKRLVLSFMLAATAVVAPALAQTGKLAIQNDSTVAIAHIYVSPIDVDRFGPDLLKGQQIEPGATFVFTDLANGLYDMKLIDGGGSECTLKDVDYFQYSVWTITQNCGAFGGTGK